MSIFFFSYSIHCVILRNFCWNDDEKNSTKGMNMGEKWVKRVYVPLCQMNVCPTVMFTRLSSLLSIHCQIDAFACSFFLVYRFSFNTCPCAIVGALFFSHSLLENSILTLSFSAKSSSLSLRLGVRIKTTSTSLPKHNDFSVWTNFTIVHFL